MKQDTLAVHFGYDIDPTTKSITPPLYQTVAYEFDNAQHGADLFNLSVAGNIYTRIMNPTTDVLEKRVAALEGGIAGLAVASGMAAIHYAIINLAKTGDNIVTAPQLYGGTHTFFTETLKDYGIEARFAKTDDAKDIAKLIDENTKAVYAETIGNPAGNIVDIEALAKVAHKAGVPVIVDNTVATPILWQPIENGADIVVHATTKYINGHANSIGGVIVDSGKFPWAKHADKFPQFSTPDTAYHGTVFTDAFGPAAFIARARTVILRNTGSALSPFNAWLTLIGLETLALRVERHVENAQKVAEFLEQHPKVSWVKYPGLKSSEYYKLAQKYTGGKPSAILSFGLKDGYDAAVTFNDKLELVKRLVNIGDTRSLACHPASTTHRQMEAEDLKLAGVSPELIRLSIGIEAADDIITDLKQALA